MAFGRIVLYLRMIKFSHSVFALPFALTAALIAAGGLPPAGRLFWIAVAMVGARSGAMGLNRVIDRKIDALNPRTAGRELPSKKISVASAMSFSAISLAVMVYAAYKLNDLCLRLSPIAIAVVVLYSYTKRFTWLSHFVLGIALSAAPLGAWIAVRGTFEPEILPLALAVALWLPGFDMLYALLDVEFDKKRGLFSIPARFGVPKTLFLSRVLHLMSWAFLLSTGLIFHLGPIFYLGLFVVAALIIYEHSIVRPEDPKKIMAFFNMNGYIGVAVFVFTAMDMAVK